MIDWRQVQKALYRKGFNPGPIDGIKGKQTSKAIIAFKKSIGFWPRDYVGPKTLKALGITQSETLEDYGLPWIQAVNSIMGMHETRNNRGLMSWLKSDGRALGDPSKLPWCGDLVDTAIAKTLPLEPRTERLESNPYLARNWLEFGEGIDIPCFGAVVVFWRGSIRGHSGHVGFIVGIDKERNRILTRGGNQSNEVNDSWLKGNRVLGYRWPITFTGEMTPVPEYNSSGQRISTNEA